jgi:predicted RNA binding protein YcfA (HicA-like mRNA interferase family)
VKFVSGKHLCKVVEKRGWVFQRIRGSHHIYAQPGNPTILTIPVHGNNGFAHRRAKQGRPSGAEDGGFPRVHLLSSR